jgi:hypothetical protein
VVEGGGGKGEVSERYTVHVVQISYLFFSYYIQHCFICRPSDSTVPKDAGIEPRSVQISHTPSEAEFLDIIQTKVLTVFLLAIQSHLHSFALRFLFLQSHSTSYSFCNVLLYTVKEKGGKSDRKPHPFKEGGEGVPIPTTGEKA